ncbi:MAG: folate-binding protein YgfZ [Paraglaciecola sp.]|jgi:folate-binding protein YgfZ
MSQIDNANQLPENFLTRLTNQGIIEVDGEQRISYLQGQVTADMQELSGDKSLLGCHCDFKGKAWNIFYAAQFGESALLIGHKESLMASFVQLQKYAVFAKVGLSISEDWVCLAGAGEKLESLIEERFTQLPTGDRQTVSNAQGLVMAIQAPIKRYMLVLTAKAAQEVVDHYDQELADTSLWELLDIQAGIPQLQESTSNEFVPQMMNVQALEGISFNKGCYMGQEVVARTKFLGKNKRAAVILKAEEAASVVAGDILESPAGDNWRKGGTVLRAAQLNSQTWLLAVVANDTVIGSVMRLKSHPDSVFTVQNLPYSLA